jgi:phosphoglycolate phosphatase
MDIYINSLQSELKDISGVIFDKDGTLTDSHVYWAKIIELRTNKIIDAFSIQKKYTSLISESMGLNIEKNRLLPKGPIALETRSKVIELLVEKISFLNKEINKKSISELFVDVQNEFKGKASNYIEPIISACKFVDLCKKNNLKLALITSDTRNNALEAIDKLNLKNKFDIVIGGDSNFGDKKKGNSAKYVCKYLNLDPTKVVSIGDAPSDQIMAKNACLRGSILVQTGQIPIEDLSLLSKYSVNSLDDVSFH